MVWHRRFKLDDPVYIFSDPHISHTNIVSGVSKWTDKSGCRDFPSVDEMNAAIHRSIYSLPKGSILICLGDMKFQQKNELPGIIASWRQHLGEIHILWGNHDGGIYQYKDLFDSYHHYLEIVVGKRLWCLMHYPIWSWNDMARGSYMVSGHTHGSLPRHGKAVDMDWGIWRKPLSLQEIDEILSKRDLSKVDHHG